MTSCRGNNGTLSDKIGDQMLKIGDRVKARYVSLSDKHFETKLLTAWVEYIHPKGRYVMVKDKRGLKECFKPWEVKPY